MKKVLALACLISSPVVLAETAPVQQPRPVAPTAKPGTVAPAPAPAPATSKPPTTAPAATTAPAPKPVTPPAAKPVASASATTPAPAAAPGAAAAAAPVPLTLEQRHQIELLANAERIDKANRELLARNQELQLTNENLDMQLNIIRHDKSSEGIWKGALAVIAGFLMGWFFATSSRKSSW